MSRPPKNRPYILLNMSMSADGKIASPAGDVQHFSSRRDSEHLYELRATVDAVMNGARTVDTSPIKMDPGSKEYRRRRLQNGLSEYNLRIIVSGSGSIDPNAEVFRHRFSPIIILTSARCPKRKLKRLREISDDVIISPDKSIDFPDALKQLRRKWKVRRLLCEGGGGLNDALFRADLIDEARLTVCPLIIGGAKAPTISDGVGFDALNDARRFELKHRRRSGEEMFLTYRRK